MPCVSNVSQMCLKCITFSRILRILRALLDFAPRPHLQSFHRTVLGLMPSGEVLHGHQVWVNASTPSSSSTKYILKCSKKISKVVYLLMSAALFPFGQGCTSSYRRAVEINPFREIMPRNLCKVHHSSTAIRRTLRLKPSHSSLYAPTHVVNMVCGRQSSTQFLHVFSIGCIKRIHPKRN